MCKSCTCQTEETDTDSADYDMRTPETRAEEEGRTPTNHETVMYDALIDAQRWFGGYGKLTDAGIKAVVDNAIEARNAAKTPTAKERDELQKAYNSAQARYVSVAKQFIAEKKTNAKLLEALELLTKEFLHFVPGAEENNSVLLEAKAAIAAAKGAA